MRQLFSIAAMCAALFAGAAFGASQLGSAGAASDQSRKIMRELRQIDGKLGSVRKAFSVLGYLGEIGWETQQIRTQVEEFSSSCTGPHNPH